MAWFDVKFDGDGELMKRSAGKQQAWINYMTNVNEVFGTFCDRNKMGSYVLTREYEVNNNLMGIKDLTTYIDPRKYTYAFATTELADIVTGKQIGRAHV